MVECSIHDLRDLRTSPEADAVVVIDVLRAFSTAAVAFHRGAVEIFPVLNIEEAFGLRYRFKDIVLMGEQNCHPVQGFDLGNSPVAADKFPFAGRRVAQRTTAGTRGLVCCYDANSLWAASFLVARATVREILKESPSHIAFVITGTVHYGSADEDLACAEWMADLVRGESPDPEPFLERVRTSVAAATFQNPTTSLFAPEDVGFCARADIFPFAMKFSPGSLTLETLPSDTPSVR